MQCLCRFFVAGMAGGFVGGFGTSLLNSLATSTLVQFIPLGITFGISLWLATGLFVDRLSVFRTAVLIPGCLLGFAVAPVVTTLTLPPGWSSPQPWTWKLLYPYVLGPAAGAAFIVLVVRCVSGRIPGRVMFLVWLCISAVGFPAFFAVDELGLRTRQFAEPTLAFLCGGGFVAVVLALIGWQLAEAHLITVEATQDGVS